MTINKSDYEKLINEGENLINYNRSGAKTAKQWCNKVRDWLNSNLPNSGLSEDVSLALPKFEPTASGRGLRPSDQKGVQKILGILLSAKKMIPALNTEKKYIPSEEGRKKVFIVHGHDENLKNNVARLIERLGLEVIILHEQPNRGRTVIEKFTEHSNVAFAVVLLTGDDFGGVPPVSEKNSNPRARQNVIFEFGYFIGKIGRDRVCAIYQEGVELPSDYQGVLYIPYDERRAWEVALSKELRDAGLQVDLNKI